MSDERTPLPPPLSQQRDATGTLLRRYLRQQPAPDEPQAWQELRTRLLPRPRPRLSSFALLLGAGAAVATILVGWRLTRTEPPARPVAAERPLPAPQVDRSLPAPPLPVPAPPPVADTGHPPVLRLQRQPVSLPRGPSTVEGEAEVSLPPPGRALAFRSPSGPRIELRAGRIGLHVYHQEEGQRLEVAVPPYRFVVRGTRFEVTRKSDKVQLAVREGRVDVHRGARLSASVRAGGAWQGSLRPLPPVAAETRPPGPPKNADCREVGDPRAVLACYRARAAGTDLAAEVALSDGAKLLRDRLADPDQALALLREHRARFPHSDLRTEVDLSLVELAAERGLHEEVLEVSAALLAAQPQGERAGELHLLRATAYREGLRDWASAESEYTRAAAAPGRARGEALYWRARCLEQLGRTDDAIAAYRAAIERPDAAHAAEARRRLSALRGAP